MKRTAVATLGLLAFILSISTFALVRPARDAGPETMAQLQTSAPVNISNTSNDSGYPLIGLDASGAAYVVWLEYPDYDVFFSTNKTGPWSAPQRATTITPFGTDSNGHKSLAVAPNGVCHLLIRDAGAGANNREIWHILFQNAWGTRVNVSNSVGDSFGPACAVDPASGVLPTVWMDWTNQEGELGARSRLANGAWTAVQALPVGIPSYVPDLDIDAGGRGHMTWTQRLLGDYDVFYAGNANPLDAAGWTPLITVKEGTKEDKPNPKIACDNAGNAYIAWKDGNPGNDEIFVCAVYSDGSMSQEVNVSQSVLSSTDPDIAVNRNNGNVYIIWTEDGDIFGNFFEDDQWSGPTNLSNSAGESGEARVAVDNGGNVRIVYHENIGNNYEIFYLSIAAGGTSTTSTGTTSIPPRPFPPLNPALDTQLDASETQKINTLTWQRNPSNQNIELNNYRVYRKRSNMSDSDFAQIASVAPNILVYADSGLLLTQKYTYGLTALPKDTRMGESAPSALVSEAVAFPPLGVACRMVVNNSLFRQEKINIISWRKNPLNNAVTLFQYNIYRKIAGQDDAPYEKIGSVGGTLLEYMDRRLPFTESYQYVVTAVETGGYESRISGVAREVF